MTIKPSQVVSTERAYEVRHWMREVPCTEIELFEAILAVGRDLNDIRHHRETLERKGVVSIPCPPSDGH